ncbi:DNA polymerase III subunit epsilon [Acidithiobacillus thiooxidans]|uniref:DNA polymerase III subunit epsilon n=1 Tax=Acidithiobacillus thiooxidans ATCC 19377 TaxID=637390 RepID=A0A543Q147_ACITH|nr:DNA polymerase III subunit epsilon [Acidithiobacillus thiooxidans]MDR7925657.1 DNA polymerase III subunit epsilon [Acidithiobacillus thiooxidans]MDX5933234.1 DNA polymerase III subunit epsilon [Acidithiobacillus thiooxidans]TQN50054.1 DNA polymerase III subunit epsilon [Acidithiobacillus thiooxidans ATCC 19377]
MALRQVVLDTETTGIDWKQGHRVIEIGAVELLDRRLTGNNYQQYLNPQRSSDPEALRVHGLSDAFLADKPLFAEVAENFLNYLGDAELIIHNAPFDLGFLNHELGKIEKMPLNHKVLDTLVDARRRHPGQKNDLNSLCRRYNVDNSHRELHGALLDCEILAKVYLGMTGGQVDMMGLLNASEEQSGTESSRDSATSVQIAQFNSSTAAGRPRLRVIRATAEETALHAQYLEDMGGKALWNAP